MFLTILKFQIELISCLSKLLYYYLDLLQLRGTETVWLGGSAEAVEGTWVWTDGSPGVIFLNLFNNKREQYI